VVKGRRPSVGHLGHPVRVEKVGEVTGYGTISYTQSSLTLYRKEKVPHLAHLGHLVIVTE